MGSFYSIRKRVVVCGRENNNEKPTTVEVYDHVADAWTYLPNMIVKISFRKTAAFKNKVFIIVSSRITSCKVFDSTYYKLVSLKLPKVTFLNHLHFQAGYFLIGSNI